MRTLTTRHVANGLTFAALFLMFPAFSLADTLTISAGEKTILDKTNAERAKLKLPPLKPNAKLFAASRAHSKNLAATDRFAHTVDGKGPGERAKDHGYPSAYVGENIAGSYDGPDTAMRNWMNSNGHRNNILGTTYTEIGIGMAVNSKGMEIWTQKFGASDEAEKPPTVVVAGKKPEPKPETEKKPAPKPEVKKPEVNKPDTKKPEDKKLDTKKPEDKKPTPKAGGVVLDNNGRFADTDVKGFPGFAEKRYELPVTAGKTYTLELTSQDFEAYLEVEGLDTTKKYIALAPREKGTARLVIKPTATQTVKIFVSTVKDRATGAYHLKVTEN